MHRAPCTVQRSSITINIFTLNCSGTARTALLDAAGLGRGAPGRARRRDFFTSRWNSLTARPCVGCARHIGSYQSNVAFHPSQIHNSGSMRSLLIALICFLSILPTASAQESTDSKFDRFKVDCVKFDQSPGCGSYNEMMASHDPDLIKTLTTGFYHSFVCFRPDDDVFATLYFVNEDFIVYKKNPQNQRLLQADGGLSFASYKKCRPRVLARAQAVLRNPPSSSAQRISVSLTDTSDSIFWPCAFYLDPS